MELKDKVAIVTGSTSGMGKESAIAFANEGAKVVVTGRRGERAKEVVDEIVKNGGEAIYVVADMLNLEDVENIFHKTIEAYGKVDILFNNAGMLTYDTISEISIENWENVFKVNVTAPLLLSQLCAEDMKKRGSGSILITGSVAGLSSKYGIGAYVPSKHAANGLTKALARDLGPDIRVNAILPGAIATEMLDDAGGAESDAIAPMREASPLKRVGTSEEIANTAVFLASDKSSFITGQLIRVDGGIDC